jgi:hypothetical protein
LAGGALFFSELELFMKRFLWGLAAWGLLVGGVREAWAGPIAELSLQSQPGDFIGQGQTKDIIYTPVNSDFFISQILTGRNVAGQPAFLSFVLGTVTGSDATNTFTTLDFATDMIPLPFQTGAYTNAQRASFATAGHAGLDVTFQNRGSNTLTGSFTVNSVSFFTDASNMEQIGSLDVNFEQHSEGATPALFGHFVYNASPTVSGVPEPTSLSLIGIGLISITGYAWGRRRRKELAIA